MEKWRIIDAEFVAAATSRESLPAQLGVEIAFAGRSNVGKSSLMNALMERRKLVRTSSTPGCTRQINFFRARAHDGAEFRLIDLPGYGYAKRSKTERAAWGDLLESYLAERQWLKAVVVLFDVRHGMTEDDKQMFEFASSPSAHVKDRIVIIVGTKVDKLKKSKRRAALDKLESDLPCKPMFVSAVTGEGIEAIWTALRSAVHVA